jgi:hypothetical protein
MITTWFDVAHFNAAVTLAVAGFVVRWIIRVNQSFRAVEVLRFDLSLKIVAVEAALNEHEAVSESVHVDIARRLEHLERPAASRGERGH